METIRVLVDVLAVFFGGYLFLVYLCRAFKGYPVASKDNGKVHFALDLFIVTLVFVTYFIDMLVDAVKSLANFLGA